MKKIITLLLLVLVITGISLSCERDDICPEDTPTTPHLIVNFVSNADFDVAKNVSKFRVEELGNSLNVLEGYEGVTTSDVYLPLKTTANETQFVLYKDYALDDNNMLSPSTNADTITITYNKKDVYISRACGYKSVFENVQINITNQDVEDNDNWILNSQPINDNLNIEDETEAHFIFAH